MQGRIVAPENSAIFSESWFEQGQPLRPLRKDACVCTILYDKAWDGRPQRKYCTTEIYRREFKLQFMQYECLRAVHSIHLLR